MNTVRCAKCGNMGHFPSQCHFINPQQNINIINQSNDKKDIEVFFVGSCEVLSIDAEDEDNHEMFEGGVFWSDDEDNEAFFGFDDQEEMIEFFSNNEKAETICTTIERALFKNNDVITQNFSNRFEKVNQTTPTKYKRSKHVIYFKDNENVEEELKIKDYYFSASNVIFKDAQKTIVSSQVHMGLIWVDSLIDQGLQDYLLDSGATCHVVNIEHKIFDMKPN